MTDSEHSDKDVEGKETRAARPSLMDGVRASMKSMETEGPFEMYATRTPGYLFALLFKALHVHPIAVTLLSLVLGAGAGWFFGQTDWRLNLAGMGLLLVANWLDCADGQLARMTGKKTLIGRILDGFAGDVWFFFIYFFICLRLQPEWGVWIWVLAAWSGFYCHARQCALADYYRNIHLRLIAGGNGGELDRSDDLQREMQALSWNRKEAFHKLYLFFYVRYTRGQERQTPMFNRLRNKLRDRGGELPAGPKERFLNTTRPLMTHCNVLTFDTRVGVLFLSLLIGVPWVYFVFECTVLEGLRWYVRSVHERASCRLLYEIKQA